METGTANIKPNIQVDETCVKCFKRTFLRLSQKFNFSEQNWEKFNLAFDEIIEKNHNKTSPEIQVQLSKAFSDIAGVDDLFESEKSFFNALAMQFAETWKPKIKTSANSFDTALRLAIAGNIIDFGAYNEFNLNNTIEKVLNEKFAINHSENLKQALANANKVLYLGDNAGEIAFDKLFIENLNLKDITFAVRGGPALNDVLLQDAQEIDMQSVAKVISNGYNAPSTILHKCSDEFKTEFNNADVIISKGQGNLEGLLSLNDSRIYFLLMVKCNKIAELLNVKKGDFVVMNPSVASRASATENNKIDNNFKNI